MRTTKALMCLGALAVAACGGGGASGGAARATTSAVPTRVVGATVAAVEPIPAGYHSITPVLVVASVGRAIRFYERALGARERERVAADDGGILHAEIQIGDSVVMLAPEMPERGRRAPIGVEGSNGGLYVYVEDVDATLARATNAGATTTMPATDMFWGDRYAQVRDPSGHYVSLASHRFDLAQEEMHARAVAVMQAAANGQEAPTFAGGPIAASWRPDGYFTVTPMLVVNTPEDIDFYVEAFGATQRERMVRPDGSLMHGEIEIGDSVVMLSTAMEEEPSMRTPGRLGATTLALYQYVPDVDDAFARAIRAGAQVVSPLRESFRGDRMGSITDRSGQTWSIATHVRDVSLDEMRAATGAGG